MVDQVKPIVTITGVSGFIGAQVCLDFLKCGEYRVRGTVRDKKNEAKIAPLRKAFGEYFDQLELVEADLLDADSLTRAIAGSTYVVHTASPFYYPKEEEEVVKPAVEGTMSVMHACVAANVKRCVITSSIVSIICMAQQDKPDIETGFYDETCWSNPERPEGLGPYPKSKTLAEKAAWDFQKSLPEDKRFEIVTVCPCFVMGPTLIPGGFYSADYMMKYFDGRKKEIGKSSMGIVDVRDVSKLHLEAVRRPDVANQRFLAYSERIYGNQFNEWIAAEFGPKGYKVPKKDEKAKELSKDARVSNKKARETFGMEFIPAKDSLIAMANSLIEHGILKKL